MMVDDQLIDQIKRNPGYRYLLRPALGWWRERRGVSANPDAPAPATQLSLPPPPDRPQTAAAQEIYAQIDAVEWYHSIDLPHGVSTPGYVDHRTQIGRYGLPATMRGLRALDVATYDGFWAFEMERRGAEVVAIDLESLAQCDYPRRFREHALREAATRKLGEAFGIAHRLLGSRVDRREMSVYELSPERVGTFDVVFLSDLLLHLRDAALAIEAVCSVVRPGGFAIIAEPFNGSLDGGPQPLSQFGFGDAIGWWHHSSQTLKTMMYVAGFDEITEISRFDLISRAAIPLTKIVLKGQVNPLPATPASALNGHQTTH